MPVSTSQKVVGGVACACMCVCVSKIGVNVSPGIEFTSIIELLGPSVSCLHVKYANIYLA